MSTREEIVTLLRRLRLAGVQESLEVRLRQAREDRLGYAEFLYRLLSDEAERRERRQLELRLRRACFEQEKVLEDFDFGFNPEVPRERVLELATCRFVGERRNVLLVGPTGVGKSHLAQALGHQACRAGYTVRYVAARALLAELRAARADESHERVLVGYVKPALLIVDDFGLTPMLGEEPQDLYEVVRRRYQRGATVWTSNREPREWLDLFVDPLLGSAAVDRVLHDAELVELGGDTWRNPPPGKQWRQDRLQAREVPPPARPEPERNAGNGAASAPEAQAEPKPEPEERADEGSAAEEQQGGGA